MISSTVFCFVILSISISVLAFSPIPSKSFARHFSTRLFDVEEKPDSVAAAAGSSYLGIDEVYIPFPSSDYTGTDVVELCMNALLHNTDPYDNAGLEVCWNFSSDRCRAAQGGSLEQFIDFANNPVFSSMVNAQEWSVQATGNVIPGTPTRGAMQTVLVHVTPQKGRIRDFLWTLQCERRPPRQNCWLVHECIDKDAAYRQTL